MVLPLEGEERTLRNLVMICQDHSRLVVEIYRKMLQMIDDLVKGELERLGNTMDEVESLHAKALEVRMNVMRELHETGGVLINREEFYRLISKSSELTDYIEEICVRIYQIGERRWRIPKNVGEGLMRLAEATFQALTKLRESLISLGFNPERATVLAKDVDEIERNVDSIYRDLSIMIITSDMGLPLLLILKDIAEELEFLTDAAKDEADIIRILAL
ncbi:DUF47 family protein [Candidatus Bathyarchaeota archaeon]|nr:DUF47 family protein [Candidatus Bathyarchaeota archaeon]